MKNIFAIVYLLAFLLIFLCLGFCSTKILDNKGKNILTLGIYKTTHYSFFDKVKLYINGVRHLPKGNSLEIKNDSTFNYLTCRNSTSGTWSIIEDTLYLKEKKAISNTNNVFNNTNFLKKFKIVNSESIVLIYSDSTWYEKLINNSNL